MRPVHIIGVPQDLGAGRRGVDMGPSAVRIAGLDRAVQALGYPLLDKGDLRVPIPETEGVGAPRNKFPPQIAEVCERVFQAARSTLEQGALPLVLEARTIDSVISQASPGTFEPRPSWRAAAQSNPHAIAGPRRRPSRCSA